jgi:hypothetical protein
MAGAQIAVPQKIRTQMELRQRDDWLDAQLRLPYRWSSRFIDVIKPTHRILDVMLSPPN